MSRNERRAGEGYRINRDFIAMTAPVYLMSCFFYGPRVLLLALVAMLVARITDRLAALMRGRRYDRTENSSVAIALVMVLMMPANVRYLVVVAAVLVAVLVGKEAFGGYGAYPFNPAAVGFCVVCVSWPQEVLMYPAPQNWLPQQGMGWDALWKLWDFVGAAPQNGLVTTLRAGGLPKTGFWDLILGNYPAAMGVNCILVILSCAVYLVLRKRMSVLAPAGFLAVVVMVAFFMPRYSEISWASFPQDVMLRLQVVKYELLSGGLVYAAVFLINEPVTLPKHRLSRLIYGALIGIAAMMFRYYGAYEMGICFAVLLVNAFSGYFDRAIAGGLAVHKKEVAV